MGVSTNVRRLIYGLIIFFSIVFFTMGLGLFISYGVDMSLRWYHWLWIGATADVLLVLILCISYGIGTLIDFAWNRKKKEKGGPTCQNSGGCY